MGIKQIDTFYNYKNTDDVREGDVVTLRSEAERHGSSPFSSCVVERIFVEETSQWNDETHSFLPAPEQFADLQRPHAVLNGPAGCGAVYTRMEPIKRVPLKGLIKNFVAYRYRDGALNVNYSR